ncbi:acyl carrier protein [Christiangramia crocea]|uniref:Phosphopantetheine-binding protein n=1 Tax=Christiangramia crocea TaxID=2904124 RepID=A0A9X1UWJ3_9FLAO|nr:phosphopantetheine-binding protein [Gramella crocea]MCG9971675.1 phosphopantetheine-binding protein [Gramella crocea]
MKENEIKQELYALLQQIAPETEPSALAPDENIKESLDIDSFDTLRFIVSVNEKFEIEIPEEDYGKITTIGLLTNYIQKKM